MYENQTEEVIFKRMMGRLPASLDKREGSVIYDSTMPAAIEFMLIYAMCDWFLKNTFADTAEREWLIERAKERGLHPEPATAAIVKGIFTPPELIAPIGARFSYDDINYVVTEKVSSGVFLLHCETNGVIGNKPAGPLIPIDYVKNLQTAAITEVTVPGEDEEETERFRERYLNSFDNQAYGGNIADYREKVNKIQGVGGVKVYPTWRGGGTVRIAFMTSEYKIPSAEFVDRVQTILDPIPNQGQGVGVAPIGHIVTVEGVKNSAVQIELQLTFSGAWTFADLKAEIEAVIDDYFLELNKLWQNTQKVSQSKYSNTGIIIRIAQIESRLLDLDEIDDVQHTKLNGAEENLALDTDALAVRGEVIG